MREKSCYHCHGDGTFCGALSVEECPENCTFFQTEKDFVMGRAKAAEALEKKGLQAVTNWVGDKKIMTTERIPKFGYGKGWGNK